MILLICFLFDIEFILIFALVDNVNTSETLDTTKYETQCGADLVNTYLESFVENLIDHVQDTTGNCSKLKTYVLKYLNDFVAVSNILMKWHWYVNQ